MGARRGPTLRAQWLGQQLRELREASKLTLKDAAEYLQRDPSTVSRFETGVYPIRRPDLLALLDLYQVSSERRRDELVRLSDEVWQTGWWDGYAKDVTGLMVDRIWLESRTNEVRAFQSSVVPGLLQTRAYAEAVIRAGDPHESEDQIGRWIEFRMRRQQALTRPEPMRLRVVLDEAATARLIGGPAVMAEQLGRLLDAIDGGNVEVRILPFAAGAHASLGGAFEIFELDEPYPDVAYVESPAGTLYLETDGVDRLARMYDQLCGDALSPADSMALISAAIKNLG